MSTEAAEQATVNNRRTFCDHCSLCADVAPFIGREHAQGNVDRIRDGEIFGCHMVFDPLKADKTPACLGAAMHGGVKLANPVTDSRRTYKSLEEYVETQAASRRTNAWLMMHGDLWFGGDGQTWYGFWASSPTKRWEYFLTTLEENNNDSAYKHFDRAQELFGPMERKPR